MAPDKRTWRDRVENAAANWKEQLPLLVEGYLKLQRQGPPVAETREPELVGDIQAVDLYTLQRSVTYSVYPGQRTSEAVLAAGYLVNSPVSPSMAISIKTLEMFRCLRLYKASFSTEAFTKLICHYYMVE